MFNVLVVDPDTRVTSQLRRSIQNPAYVETQRRFDAAKRRLASAPFDFLVTNIRLGEINGLHLVYLSAAASNPLHAIVYTAGRDQWLAREVQRAGAFYETLECLPVTLAAYFTRTLPPSDRRDISRIDRRADVRGGRRCWDRHIFHASS
jgi:DNA-binding NtrC family response regulator